MLSKTSSLDFREGNQTKTPRIEMKTVSRAALFLLGFILSAHAQSKEAAVPSTNSIAAKDAAFAPAVTDPKLPRVLLIGDSICIGYAAHVRHLLKGKANVYRIPENGGPTTNGLAKLKSWLGDGHWDVIHFNFGLHDLKLITGGQRRITPDEYERNLGELAGRLKSAGAKLIWASTTPVPEPLGKLGRVAADVPVYNARAKKVMAENHIPTNDLYDFALPQLSKIQRPANVHYTEEGYEALAKQVAASIEAALEKKQ
jgi:acyl-CoA thioesterase-1